MIRPALLCLALVLAACGSSSPRVPETVAPLDPVLSTREAKQLFGNMPVASNQRATSLGSYSKGCLAGAEQLPETGATWQAMRLSRNRNWGHPELIDYLGDLSRAAARQPGWNGLYIGDLSQPRGGPMLTGHVSHQIGLDADIWMLPATDLSLSRAERESISSISLQRANGAYTNDNWSRQHHEILKAAASDPRVARVFVFPAAKVRMCAEETGNREWLRKVRPIGGHHYHFHVRLNCPRGASDCVDQAPPPPGDGCADAQAWVNNLLNPPPADPDAPPSAPRAELTMADLPRQCAAVLAAD